MADYNKLMQDALKKLEKETKKRSKKKERREAKAPEEALDKKDPYSDEDDVETLVCLTLREGYWREDWGTRPNNVRDRIAGIRELYKKSEVAADR